MEEPEYSTAEEMRVRLRKIFREDPERSLLARIGRGLLDPASPEKRRPHPLWLSLALLALFAASVFVGLTLVRS